MSVGGALAALVVFASAVLTVQSTRLVHAVLWLGLVLAGTAVLFIQFDAPFLAAIQLLLYVGGVMTLMIFGVMLTRSTGDGKLPIEGTSYVRAGIASAGLFVLLTMVIARTSLGDSAALPTGTTADLGRAILTDHLLSFEILSVLLLASMVGAIVIARRKDPDAPATTGEAR